MVSYAFKWTARLRRNVNVFSDIFVDATIVNVSVGQINLAKRKC